MVGASDSKSFLLEALEPRVLLSGTDLVAPIVPPANVQVQADESQAVAPQNSQEAISYDPASRVDSILGGATENETGKT